MILAKLDVEVILCFAHSIWRDFGATVKHLVAFKHSLAAPILALGSSWFVSKKKGK
jgi:hypothetical protein